MGAPHDFGDSYRGSGMWLATAMGLLVAGWGTFFLTLDYADRLAERWGPAPDVVDALGREAYIGRQTLAYLSGVLLLDMLAAGALGVESRPGWPRVLKVLVAVLLVLSALLHGLTWLVTGLFTH